MRPPETRVASVWADFADHVYADVKGYAPLVNDIVMQQFRSLLLYRSRNREMTAATMVGTYYAGSPIRINNRLVRLGGYGHMGCCSLFVISQVESIDSAYSADLRYSTDEWK